MLILNRSRYIVTPLFQIGSIEKFSINLVVK
jgi:hypothetical protein